MDTSSKNRPVNATDDDFEIHIQDHHLVLADFWATWCPPCKAQSPILDEIAQHYGDRVKVVKLEVDSNPKTAAAQNVRALPTLKVFKDGKPVKSVTGLHSVSAIQDFLDRI